MTRRAFARPRGNPDLAARVPHGVERVLGRFLFGSAQAANAVAPPHSSRPSFRRKCHSEATCGVAQHESASIR